METIRTCPQCRQPLPENAPEGLCPSCLAKVALGSESAGPGGTINIDPLAKAAPGTRVPPEVAQLAAQFPQLEIIELLGMGGMGMVYKARQPQLDRLVALKILPVESAPHPSFAERFNREARALAKLNHPGIVAVYDFGRTSQYFYFVMEYVDGMNLRQLLQSQPIEPRQALELVTQICTALQFAHDEGVVHRDIKPENILLNKKGQVKIADFGLAKLLGTVPDTALTMSQAAMGTLNYMAPEQRQNAQGVDHRADIYSLGVVFYEMLTGEVPMGRFEAPSKRVQMDVRLDEVVLRALEREPARRYQHVSEVKSNVEAITSTPPPAPAAPASTSPTPRPTFARLVLKPVLISFLVWLALWFFARGFSYFAGMALLFAGVPGFIFDWRLKVTAEGLRWRQLPLEVRRRCIRRLIPITVACATVLIVGVVVFPSRTTEWREEWFLPKSHLYEKFALAGNITSYQIPFWSTQAVGASGTMALKIYHKDSPPVALTFSLPGLLIDNGSRDPGQPPQALTLGVLTDWFHDSAGLDGTQPQAQTEARQIMELFEPYSETAPGSWKDLTDKAIVQLHDFDLGGFNVPRADYGAFGWLTFVLLAFPGLCVCLYYLLSFPSFKRAFAEGRAEIEASRWTPPKVALVRLPAAFWALFGPLFLIVTLALAGQFQGHTGALAGILLSLGVLMLVVLQLHSRRQIHQAREKGLWPRLGELPTLAQVQRLAQAGEVILAIKLYRQMRGASLADAKAAVEKLAGQPGPLKAETSPTASPPSVATKPDHFWRKLVVVVLAVLAAVILLIFMGLFTAIAIPNFVKARQQSQQNVAQQANQEGWQLWQAGNFEAAQKKFAQAAELDPGKVEAWNGLGWTWFNSGHSQAAETNFQKALSLDSNYPGALNGLGQIYLSRRNYEPAEKYLLQAAPKAPAARFGLARLYLLQGKFDRAAEWAQKLVDSGQADDIARQMLKAAQEKHLSDALRRMIEQAGNGRDDTR
jgi:tetratricopeptide (TPR) repeat protein/predicted Ser/Thr protein kinase